MKNQTLCSYFDCSRIEELYEKVIAKDASVQELIDFIDYRKQNLQLKPILDSPEKVVGLLTKSSPLRNNEIKAITLNSKLSFNNLFTFPLDEDNTVIAKKLLYTVNYGIMFFAHQEDREHQKLQSILEFCKAVGLNNIDNIFYDESHNRFYSEKTNGYVNEIPINILSDDQEKMLSELKLYDEFAQYYSETNNKNLNIYSDTEDIVGNLKIGYQNLEREIFGYIGLDKNGNIVEQKVLFQGGVNISVVDQEVLFKDILENENIVSIIPFHNHPSGSSENSREDIFTTNRMFKVR